MRVTASVATLVIKMRAALHLQGKRGALRAFLALLLVASIPLAMPLFVHSQRSGSNLQRSNYSNHITGSAPLVVDFTPKHGGLAYLQMRFIADEGTGSGTGITATLLENAQNQLMQQTFTYEELAGTKLCTLTPPPLQKGKNYQLLLASTSASQGYRMAIGSRGAPEIKGWQWAQNPEQDALELFFYYPRALRTRSFMVYALLCALAAAGLLIPSFIKRKSLQLAYQLAVLCAAAALAIYCIETLAGTGATSLGRGHLLLNLFLAFSLYFLFYCITARGWAAVLLGNLVLLGGGIVNYYTLLFRGEALLPMDVTAAATAANVISSYRFAFSWEIATTLAAFAFTLAAARRERYVLRGLYKRCVLGAGGVAVALLAFFAGTTSNVYSRFGAEINNWNPTTSSRTNGFLLNFMMHLGSMQYQKPAGYTDDAVLQMAAGYPPGTPSAPQPNIVVVMNESLADFTGFENLALRQDYLPGLHKLQKEGGAYVGSMVVPVLGGGTSCTEFEALTGFSMAYCSASRAPFTQFVYNETPSLARHMRAQGYTSNSLHLAPGRNWGRSRAYPLMGFDAFTDEAGAGEITDTLRGFPSDAAHYSLLQQDYELAGASAPYFNFSVTMQNHGGYNLPLQSQTTWLENAQTYPEAEQYFAIANASDTAFADFLAHWQSVQQPTVVVMFGDHLPAVEKEFFDDILGKDRFSLAGEELLQLYKTPVVIWANYPLDYASLPPVFSANYLQAALLQLTGQPMAPYQQFLADCMEKLPVYSYLGFYDADGNYLPTLEGTAFEELYQNYSYWQYAGITRFGHTRKAFELAGQGT